MKDLKKLLSLILLLTFVVNVFACSKKTIIASGGTSGTYYGFSGVIAQRLNEIQDNGLTINVVSTGASKANIQMVNDGDADIAIVQNDVMSYAYNKTDMFENDESAPYTTFSAIASCYPEAIQIVANKSISSINDLRGKRVSVGDAGSGTEFNAKQILSAYGLDIENDITKSNQSFADSCDALKNGTIDAAFVTAGHPTVAVTELASNFDFNILPVDANHAKILVDKYGFYAPVTIAKDTYPVLSNDVPTVAVMATFIASNKLDENIVYEFTKGLFEEKDNFNHQKAELLSLDTATSGIPIPYHPGAIKYFNEQGININ